MPRATRWSWPPITSRPAPRARTRLHGVAQHSGSTVSTATHVQATPITHDQPKSRTTSWRASDKDAIPIAVVIMVRKQATPTVESARRQASRGVSPAASPRRMSTIM